MASRYSEARPKRAGEEFARIHHSQGGSDGKRVRFDVRNPSTLAMEAREEDVVLDADVIGVGTATKRGAVNLDGYDSDSDTETFNAKAANRKEGKVDIRQIDDYDARQGGSGGGGDSRSRDQDARGDDEDEDEDMFAEDADDRARPQTTSHGFDNAGRKEKETHFLDSSQIQGQEDSSKSGGRVRLDEEESSDDEADVGLAMEEEGLDEEVGAGGLKRNAPKVEAFNLRQEMEDGRFDQHGNYVRKAEDPDTVHDKWLDGLSKDLKRAAEAHARREAEAKTQRVQDDEVLVSELLKMLILQLEKTETPLEALARLGKKQAKGKKLPKWKLKKRQQREAGGDGDVEMEEGDNAEQARVKASIDSITDAADKLLSRDYEDIYEQEREMLIRDYRSTTGEEWSEARTEDGPQDNGAGMTSDGPPGAVYDGKQWEFRWTDGRDGGSTQGPFDGATMKAWQDAGYFGQGVEFRVAGDGEAWGLAADFS